MKSRSGRIQLGFDKVVIFVTPTFNICFLGLFDMILPPNTFNKSQPYKIRFNKSQTYKVEFYFVWIKAPKRWTAHYLDTLPFALISWISLVNNLHTITVGFVSKTCVSFCPHYIVSLMDLWHESHNTNIPSAQIYTRSPVSCKLLRDAPVKWDQVRWGHVRFWPKKTNVGKRCRWTTTIVAVSVCSIIVSSTV